MVFANCTASVGLDGLVTIRLVVNQPWDRNDPIVKLRPDLFSDNPVALATSGPNGVTLRPFAEFDRPVEQASAEPGSKRSVRRDR